MKRSPIKNHLFLLFVIFSGLFGYPHSATATVADGVFAYEKGDYKRARNEWLPYAALGNPNALYNLGQLSRMGRGVNVNYAKAEEYYLRAAEKGHVGAQRNLGTLYYFGRIKEVDHIKALNWLLKAAIQDDDKSQLMAGTMYYNGEATEKDNITAYAWIFLAAQKGLGTAADALDKLGRAMSPDQIKQAKTLAPTLISRLLSPDDVGLMIQQKDEATAELNPDDLKSEDQADPVSTQDSGPAQDTVPAADEAEMPVAVDSQDADNFRVQLASLRSEAAAQEALNDLKVKYPDIFSGHEGKIEFADLGDKGIYYRLQLAPFHGRAGADEACARLKEKGQGCYVVKTP